MGQKPKPLTYFFHCVLWWPGAESNHPANPLFMRFFGSPPSTFRVFFRIGERQPRAACLRCPESQAHTEFSKTRPARDRHQAGRDPLHPDPLLANVKPARLLRPPAPSSTHSDSGRSMRSASVEASSWRNAGASLSDAAPGRRHRRGESVAPINAPDAPHPEIGLRRQSEHLVPYVGAVERSYASP